MRRLSALLIVVCLGLVLVACPSPTGPADDQPDTTDPGDDPGDGGTGSAVGVHVAGYYQQEVATVPYDVAAYWLDGVKTDLTDGVLAGSNAQATGVFVDGSDVYVSGYVSTGGVKSAVYWKNGVQTALTAATAAEATGIFVSGGDVYVSGTRDSATSARFPVYWKNGTIVDLLTTEAANAAATGIVVDSGLVLVSGHYDNGTTNFTATLWRHDGTNPVAETDLSDGVISEAFTVAIASDGDYLAAGSFWNGSSWASASWTVDSTTFASARNELTSVAAGANWSKAFGVDELAGTVHAAGYFTSGGDQPAAWTGSTRTDLDTSGATSGRALALHATSARIVVAGYRRVAAGNLVAAVWEDGVLQDLYDSLDADLDAEARAVVVVE